MYPDTVLLDPKSWSDTYWFPKELAAGLGAGHTWISDLMLAKCVSMAPPWGKFWFILFMSSVKQLKARASAEAEWDQRQ